MSMDVRLTKTKPGSIIYPSVCSLLQKNFSFTFLSNFLFHFCSFCIKQGDGGVAPGGGVIASLVITISNHAEADERYERPL